MAKNKKIANVGRINVVYLPVFINKRFILPTNNVDYYTAVNEH